MAHSLDQASTTPGPNYASRGEINFDWRAEDLRSWFPKG